MRVSARNKQWHKGCQRARHKLCNNGLKQMPLNFYTIYRNLAKLAAYGMSIIAETDFPR
jgi:hypothetical protein